MLRSRFGSIALLAAFAVGALCSTACIVFETVRAAARVAADWVTLHVLTAASLAPAKAGQVAKTPERMLRAASSFTSRLIRRERPRIENAWRMCPST